MTETKEKGIVRRACEVVEDHFIIVGIGAIVGLTTLASCASWTSKMYKTHLESKLEQARIEAGYKLHTGDLNNNNLVDKFYLIDGKPAVVEKDGKPVIENPTIDDKLYK